VKVAFEVIDLQIAIIKIDNSRKSNLEEDRYLNARLVEIIERTWGNIANAIVEMTARKRNWIHR